MIPEPRTIGEVLREKASVHGEDVFLFFEDERVTYAETLRRASAVAAGLADAGSQPPRRRVITAAGGPGGAGGQTGR